MRGLLYKRYGMGAVLVIFAVVFIVFGVKNAGKTQEYEPYYTTVKAVITEKYAAPAEELESFADVTYADLSGIERSGRIEYSGPAEVGDTIEINMSTHNPAVIGFANAETEQRQAAEKSDSKLQAVIEIIVGVLMAVFGILLIIRHEKVKNGSLNEADEPRTEVAEAVQDNVNKYDMEEIVRKINAEFPHKPMVKLEPKRAENLSVFDSKLGGIPYMPAALKYPRGKGGVIEGRPLRLLAQLNFEKLPHIENFPTKGILQFFCSDDEEDAAYGLNFDDPTVQNGFRVIYHENIITDESLLMPKERIPKFTTDMGNFSFDGEFLLEAGAVEMCPVSAGDHHFEKTLLKILSEISGKEYKKIYELGGEEEELCEKLYDMNTFEHTCIGGYPFFTQDDPRGYKTEIAGHNVLLFQCASFYDDNRGDEIMWGDMGVANFFIKEEDLKRLDFSGVAYNWDCG